MRRLLIMTLLLSLAAMAASAQDTTKVMPTSDSARVFHPRKPGSHYHPVNDYSGLNSLRARLANPSWNGLKFPNISTGMKFDDGRIRPLSGSEGNDDAAIPVTSSATSAQVNDIVQDPYLKDIREGAVRVGAPVFIFFRLAGTYVTDSPQVLNVNAAADLVVARNLRVRITGAADSATGSAEKNAALARARAEHVASMMKERGVPEERIEVLSEGGTAIYEPVAANRNCRIELFVE